MPSTRASSVFLPLPSELDGSRRITRDHRSLEPTSTRTALSRPNHPRHDFRAPHTPIGRSSAAQIHSTGRITRRSASRQPSQGPSQNGIAGPSSHRSHRYRHSAALPETRESTEVDADTEDEAIDIYKRSSPRTPAGLPHRPRIRPSLAGPRVTEIDVEARARIVVEVAEICVAQLVDAGLTGDLGGRREHQKWRDAWLALEAVRKMQLLAPHPRPFPSLAEIVPEFHISLRDAVERSSLGRAVHLCNLARFIWTILQPDDAGHLAEGLDTPDADDEKPDVGGSRGGKGRGISRSRGHGSGQAEDGEIDRLKVAMKRNVRRRNLILLAAWKRFWDVLVPREMRTSETAMRTWLDLATQMMITYQWPTIDPPTDPDPALPLPAPLAWDMFSTTAVTRYAKWPPGGNWDSSAETVEDSEQTAVGRKWKLLAKRREKELRELKPEVLARRYPYGTFRQEMLAFIDHQILPYLEVFTARATRSPSRKPSLEPDTQSESESHSSSMGFSDLESTHDQAEPWTRKSGLLEENAEDEEDSKHGTESSDFEGETNQEDDQAEQASSKEADSSEEPEASHEEEQMEGDDDVIDPGLFADVILDMDEGLSTRRMTLPLADEDQATPRASGSAHPVAPNELEESGWDIRDAALPVPLFRSGITPTRQAGPSRLFNFANRQTQAQQVGWESQSMSDTGSARITPRRRAGPSTSKGTVKRVKHGGTSQQPASESLSADQLIGMQTFDTSLDPLLGSLSVENLAGLDNPTTTTQPLFLPGPDDGSDNDEYAEAPDDKSEAEEEMDDLLPDAMQIDGAFDQSVSDHRDTPPPESVMPDDLMPPSSQLADGDDEVEEDQEADMDSEEVAEAVLGKFSIEEQGDDSAADFFTSKNGAEKGDPAVADTVVGHPVPDFLAALDASAGTSEVSEPSEMGSVPPIDSGSDIVDQFGDGMIETTSRSAPLDPQLLRALREQSERYVSGTPVLDSAVEVADEGSAVNHDNSRTPRPAPPTATHVHRNFSAGDDFADVDHEEDAEDRQLLNRVPSVTSHATPRPSRPITQLQAESPHVHIKSSPRSPRFDDFNRMPRPSIPPRPAPGPASASTPARPRAVTSLAPEHDPYIFDDDGQPLRPNPEYVTPRKYAPERSLLHGRIDAQSTSYSRLSGRRRWTKAEELLLYRTVQQVPLEEEYPLRAVWYLHGEYGTLSTSLAEFNPQHMKDKMRVIVNARRYKRQLILGRARYYLPNNDEDKIAFLEEWKEWKEEQKAKLREEMQKRAQEEANERAAAAAKRQEAARRRKAGKKVDESEEEDELESEGEEGGQNGAAEDALDEEEDNDQHAVQDSIGSDSDYEGDDGPATNGNRRTRRSSRNQPIRRIRASTSGKATASAKRITRRAGIPLVVVELSPPKQKRPVGGRAEVVSEQEGSPSHARRTRSSHQPVSAEPDGAPPEAVAEGSRRSQRHATKERPGADGPSCETRSPAKRVTIDEGAEEEGMESEEGGEGEEGNEEDEEEDDRDEQDEGIDDGAGTGDGGRTLRSRSRGASRTQQDSVIAGNAVQDQKEEEDYQELKHGQTEDQAVMKRGRGRPKKVIDVSGQRYLPPAEEQRRQAEGDGGQIQTADEIAEEAVRRRLVQQKVLGEAPSTRARGLGNL